MNDLDRMYEDIVTSANLVEAPYDEAVIKKMFEDFSGFSRSSVQFRSTDKPVGQRSLDVRYEEIGSAERPLDVAHRTGYLNGDDHEIDRLLPQIYDTIPYLGDGVDFDAQKGFSKLWYFPKGTFPVETTYDMSAMPASIAKNAWFYEKYHLSSVYIIGVDYLNKSMNLYIQFNHPDHRKPEVLRGMVEDLGFGTPPDEAIDYSIPALSAALTYTWDSPEIKRICYYVLHPQRAEVPRNMGPIVNTFVDDVPALKDSLYQISWTFSDKGSYIKVENDYTGDMMEKVVSSFM